MTKSTKVSELPQLPLTPITSGVGAPQSFEPDPFVVTLPLVGFFASGEIAHKHLYGYTGMLIVFT